MFLLENFLVYVSCPSIISGDSIYPWTQIIFELKSELNSFQPEVEI